MDTKAALIQEYESEVQNRLSMERLMALCSRECPNCYTHQYIPPSDYMCEGCRANMGL